MSQRIIFIPAMLAILVIVSTARSGGAEPAGNDCIAKPNSAPPQGSHWYYRVDRTANRRCWYLDRAGLMVRQAETAAVRNVDCEAHLREARRGHSQPEWPGGKRFDIFSRPLAIGRPK
jgi:hypothetical protein